MRYSKYVYASSRLSSRFTDTGSASMCSGSPNPPIGGNPERYRLKIVVMTNQEQKLGPRTAQLLPRPPDIASTPQH